MLTLGFKEVRWPGGISWSVNFCCARTNPAQDPNATTTLSYALHWTHNPLSQNQHARSTWETLNVSFG